MSINLTPESTDLGQSGPFALSYNAKKDRLYAKADDVTLSCSPQDAPNHKEDYPALAEAFGRLVDVAMHELMCPVNHGHEETEPEDDGGLEMPAPLRDMLDGLAKSLLTKVKVAPGTPEADLPGRPASEAPEGMKEMLAQIAKDLGVSIADIRIMNGDDK